MKKTARIKKIKRLTISPKQKTTKPITSHTYLLGAATYLLGAATYQQIAPTQLRISTFLSRSQTYLPPYLWAMAFHPFQLLFISLVSIQSHTISLITSMLAPTLLITNRKMCTQFNRKIICPLLTSQCQTTLPHLLTAILQQQITFILGIYIPV